MIIFSYEWLRRVFYLIFLFSLGFDKYIYLYASQKGFSTIIISFCSDLVVRIGKPEEVLPFLIKSVAATTSHLVFQEEVTNFCNATIIVIYFVGDIHSEQFKILYFILY